MRYIAVDWSGSLSGGGSEIWLAAVEEGRLVELRGRLQRLGAIAILCSWLAEGIEMVVGLDFAFSMPAWYVENHGCASAPDFWRVVKQEGERWLASCPAPFWGRPGRKRGSLSQYRQTELDVAGSPKSVFQVGGAGAVGTGSIRGMPHLARLREGGFAVWPFDSPGSATVVEIYPRLLTGPGPKRQAGWRRAYLDALDWPAGPVQRALAATSEDSFDATVSALGMWQSRSEFALLEPWRDRGERLEGRIWAPTRALPAVALAGWERQPGRTRSRSSVLDT